MQKTITKKNPFYLLSIQMLSGQITTRTVSLLQQHFSCNETSYAKPSTSNLASTGKFLLQQSQICCINNVFNAMLFSLQILPCIQFMSCYAPDTILIKSKFFGLL